MHFMQTTRLIRCVRKADRVAITTRMFSRHPILQNERAWTEWTRGEEHIHQQLMSVIRKLLYAHRPIVNRIRKDCPTITNQAFWQDVSRTNRRSEPIGQHTRTRVHFRHMKPTTTQMTTGSTRSEITMPMAIWRNMVMCGTPTRDWKKLITLCQQLVWVSIQCYLKTKWARMSGVESLTQDDIIIECRMEQTRRITPRLDKSSTCHLRTHRNDNTFLDKA